MFSFNHSNSATSFFQKETSWIKTSFFLSKSSKFHDSYNKSLGCLLYSRMKIPVLFFPVKRKKKKSFGSKSENTQYLSLLSLNMLCFCFFFPLNSSRKFFCSWEPFDCAHLFFFFSIFHQKPKPPIKTFLCKGKKRAQLYHT